MLAYCTSPLPLLKERAAIEKYELLSNIRIIYQIYKIDEMKLPLLQERAGGEALHNRKMSWCHSIIKVVVFGCLRIAPHPSLS